MENRQFPIDSRRYISTSPVLIAFTTAWVRVTALSFSMASAIILLIVRSVRPEIEAISHDVLPAEIHCSTSRSLAVSARFGGPLERAAFSLAHILRFEGSLRIPWE